MQRGVRNPVISFRFSVCGLADIFRLLLLCRGLNLLAVFLFEVRFVFRINGKDVKRAFFLIFCNKFCKYLRLISLNKNTENLNTETVIRVCV